MAAKQALYPIQANQSHLEMISQPEVGMKWHRAPWTICDLEFKGNAN
jgi:hypothetical protein